MHYKTKDLGSFHAVRVIVADFDGDEFKSSPFHMGTGIDKQEWAMLHERLESLLTKRHLVVNRIRSQGVLGTLTLIDSFGETHSLRPGDRIVFTEDKHLYFKQACFEYLFEPVV